ncbi:protein BEARSKIN2-like [Momordica charantia]|uniref:Protein BEARSKIN2-like n=1 Tax=Momordica charantia TaxID=3673 RepID=A0A6J1CX07_MOMCH|nr:protein BEARSKIN2-like [Momordica charantia]
MAMFIAIAAALDSIGMIGNFHSLIVGYNFEPSDQSLLEDFLFNKIYGYKYLQGPVSDCDLYGHSEPWEICESFGGIDGEDLYFFTKLNRSTNNSGQLSAHVTRKVGLAGGNWSGENTPESIFSTKYQRDFGYCKRFRYENDRLPANHAEWIMHEYSLHEDCILKVMAPKTIYKLPCRRKITTNQDTSNVPSILEMTTNQDNSNVPSIPEMTTNQDTSDVLWVPKTATHEVMSDVFFLPQMANYDDMIDVFDLPAMPIAHDTSDVPDIL